MALVDHVLVLDHVQPQVIAAPPTQAYEDVLRRLGVPEEAIRALPPAHLQQRVGAEGEAKTSASALNVSPGGIVTEVDWPCPCGARLHRHHDFVLQAWARHVAEVEDLDADHLEAHAVASITASWHPQATPRVICLCGDRWTSPSHLPDAALAAWERHVREERPEPEEPTE